MKKNLMSLTTQTMVIQICKLLTSRKCYKLLVWFTKYFICFCSKLYHIERENINKHEMLGCRPQFGA